MKFQEPKDSQRNVIVPHLPKPARNGRPGGDGRTAINAIIFALATGCRWADLPAQYGSKPSAQRGFQDLQKRGVWKRILSELIKSAHRQGKTRLQKISVDSSSIHTKTGNVTGYGGFRKIPRTKIHAAVESSGLPISIACSPASIHDSTKFADAIESVSDFLDGDAINQIVTAYADYPGLVYLARITMYWRVLG